MPLLYLKAAKIEIVKVKKNTKKTSFGSENAKLIASIGFFSDKYVIEIKVENGSYIEFV